MAWRCIRSYVTTNNTNHPPQPEACNNAAPPVVDHLLEAKLARILASVPPIIRLPTQGERCPYTQLSRSAMAELVTPKQRNRHHPPVRAIYRRVHPNAQRGIWLIPAEDLFRYLFSLVDSSVEEYRAATEERGGETPGDVGHPTRVR